MPRNTRKQIIKKTPAGHWPNQVKLTKKVPLSRNLARELINKGVFVDPELLYGKNFNLNKGLRAKNNKNKQHLNNERNKKRKNSAVL